VWAHARSLLQSLPEASLSAAAEKTNRTVRKRPWDVGDLLGRAGADKLAPPCGPAKDVAPVEFLVRTRAFVAMCAVLAAVRIARPD
jgi:hypothetical protein